MFPRTRPDTSIKHSAYDRVVCRMERIQRRLIHSTLSSSLNYAYVDHVPSRRAPIPP